MGNKNGLIDSLINSGRNKTIPFLNGKGQFSFAHGDEIALCLDNKYYILNCDSKLWEKVKKFMKSEPTLKQIKSFWLKEMDNHEVSVWSNNFDDLKKSLNICSNYKPKTIKLFPEYAKYLR